eukprot:GHRQ01008012.1.p1 GENE.GHRQ01008012.1~~GHRQ01008012.1.p1  ORF type:complete len:200 (+),score=66.62 GHRQ01008012.1:509-1108(+)
MQASLRASAARACGSRAPHSQRMRSMEVKAFFGSNSGSTATASKFYSFKVQDIDGRTTKLDKYKGKVVLVVNLASACGFTPQYAELQELYQRYSSKGLVVLGFPCNQFGQQEPGSNSDIKSFAKKSYGVTFPLMGKVDVNGGGADPLFQWLKSEKGGFLTADIKWNFSKFLVDKEGNVVGRYGSTTTPKQLEMDLAKLL